MNDIYGDKLMETGKESVEVTEAVVVSDWFYFHVCEYEASAQKSIAKDRKKTGRMKKVIYIVPNNIDPLQSPVCLTSMSTVYCTPA